MSMDRALLSEMLERDVAYFDACQSTQVEARALAQNGAPSGTLVVADSQTAGKGRLGRSWHGEPGENLAFSLILRPPLPPQQAPLLCLATAVGLANALDLRIKWPNDLLDQDGRKICGILAEMEAQASYVEYAIIGVGINVNQVGFPEELPNPGSLAMSRGVQDRSSVLRDAVFAIERWCAELSGGGDSVLMAWRKRAAHLGQRVRVGQIEGIARDVRGDGALMIDTADGIQPILTGDVEMLG